MRYADISVLGPYDYVRLIIAVTAGYLLFAEPLTTNAFVGAALILAGCILVAVTTRRANPASRPVD